MNSVTELSDRFLDEFAAIDPVRAAFMGVARENYPSTEVYQDGLPLYRRAESSAVLGLPCGLLDFTSTTVFVPLAPAQAQIYGQLPPT